MSIRARLIILVGLFCSITLALSVVSITNLGNLCDTIDEVVVRWAQSRYMAMAIDRDLERVELMRSIVHAVFQIDPDRTGIDDRFDSCLHAAEVIRVC